MVLPGKGDRQGLWARVDAAAFGMIYGSVTVLGLLMAMEAHPESPLRAAAVLFGTVLAISMAKAFADVMSTAIDSGQRITRQAVALAWHHARDTLVAANLPTVFFLVAAGGLWPVGTAVSLSQVYCTVLLMLVGARVGWRVDVRVLSAVLGAVLAGIVGATLALLKFVIH
ncbi:MAG: hypothetical protein MUF73_08590 [Rhodobacteraceae bacterium]|jgi:hypothetical protein|nr:hypothetical protein [Paracoccaceae bacterium]